jgi:hypothetical protein
MSAAASRDGSAPGVDFAPADAEETATASAGPMLQTRLERLKDLDGLALREEWRRLCRSEPPRISRDLLIRALAYRLQELEFGGLPKWAQQSLAGPAAGADAPARVGALSSGPVPPRLKLGARLVREWHGRTHAVVVLDHDAFEFEGQRYSSLTQIAREITGAHWSGPRFFGLAKRRKGAILDPACTPHDPEDPGGLAASAADATAIEARSSVADVTAVGARRPIRPARERARG